LICFCVIAWRGCTSLRAQDAFRPSWRSASCDDGAGVVSMSVVGHDADRGIPLPS
jgi:hypothetical protein